jgi:hypothetical protein
MSHLPRPDHAACPRLLDRVDAGLDSDLVGEVIAVPTIRARRSAAAKVGHARHNNALVIAQWRQPYVLAGAALGYAALPLAAEQVTLQAVRFFGVRGPMMSKAEPITLMAAERMMSMGAEPMPDHSMVKMPAFCSVRRSTTATGGSAADSSTRSSPSMLIRMLAARRPGAQRARPCA